MSDDGCIIFLQNSKEEQKEKILNERWTYLNDRTKKQIVLFRDIKKNKNEYALLIPYMKHMINMTKDANYYLEYFDSLENKKIISNVRKKFYNNYIKLNVEIMEELIEENTE